MIRYYVVILYSVLCLACANDTAQIDRLFDHDQLKKETIYDVNMSYSDSARIVMRIESPKLIRHNEGSRSRDEFPDGVDVHFLNNNGKTTSTMKAGYALRREKDGEILVRDNVECINGNEDKLRTSELFWNEKEDKLYTDKFVMITRPTRGDTILGYGLMANQDFTRFEIKKNVSGKINVKDLADKLD